MTKQESNRKYYLKNKEKISKKTKQYYLEHTESIKNWKKQYHIENKIKLCEKSNKWYKEHKEQRKLQYQNNKQEINTKVNEYFIKRRKQNVSFKILCNLRKRLWKVLKDNSKSKHTMKLVGCSIDQLKNYIESKFVGDMSWSNYGKWHIDHIKPCAKFDLSKPEEQLKCFNYTNLQPLWALDNIIKSDKYQEDLK